MEPVTLDLGDGVQRTLRFTIARIKKLKTLYGSLAEMDKVPIEEKLIPVLKIGLDKADEVSDEDLEAMIEFRATVSIWRHIIWAFNGQTPEQQEETVKKAIAAAEEERKNALTQTSSPQIQEAA